MSLVHLLRQDLSGKWMPGRTSVEFTRIPCVGEFVAFTDTEKTYDHGPYRVTKVQHYPAGARAAGGCDAEVWVVCDDSPRIWGGYAGPCDRAGALASHLGSPTERVNRADDIGGRL